MDENEILSQNFFTLVESSKASPFREDGQPICYPGYSVIKPLPNPAYRIGVSSTPYNPLPDTPGPIIQEHFGLLRLPFYDVFEAEAVFKTWSQVVPIVGFGKPACMVVDMWEHNAVLNVFCWPPFSKGAFAYWTKLVDAYRRTK